MAKDRVHPFDAASHLMLGRVHVRNAGNAWALHLSYERSSGDHLTPGAVPVLKDPFHQVDSLERFDEKNLWIFVQKCNFAFCNSICLLDVLSCLLL